MKKQFTNYLSPKRMMETEYGLVSAGTWLSYEADRITTKNTKAYVKEYDGEDVNKCGYVALYLSTKN